MSIRGAEEYLCHTQFFFFYGRVFDVSFSFDVSLVLGYIKTLKCYLSDPLIIVIPNIIRILGHLKALKMLFILTRDNINPNSFNRVLGTVVLGP